MFVNIYSHHTNSATVYIFIFSFPLNLDYSVMGDNLKLSKWDNGNITYFSISARWDLGVDIARSLVFWHFQILNRTWNENQICIHVNFPKLNMLLQQGMNMLQYIVIQ